MNRWTGTLAELTRTPLRPRFHCLTGPARGWPEGGSTARRPGHLSSVRSDGKPRRPSASGAEDAWPLQRARENHTPTPHHSDSPNGGRQLIPSLDGGGLASVCWAWLAVSSRRAGWLCGASAASLSHTPAMTVIQPSAPENSADASPPLGGPNSVGVPSPRDEEKIDDEAEDELIDDVTYDISSYGVDYTVDSLVNRLNRKVFYIPPFQRSFVWTIRQSSRFIESLLLGLPVPGIFLAVEPNRQRYLVIDGQQRLRTLQYFFKGRFQNRDFRLKGIDRRWRDQSVDDLGTYDLQRLEDSTIHTTVFKQYDPQDNRSIYLVFERLNSGASLLRSQEIRACINYGEFIKLLNRLNGDRNWRSIYGRVSNRQKDQELILRFLAFLHGTSYHRPLRDYLTSFSTQNRNLDASTAKKFEVDFRRTIEVASRALGPEAFRPERYLRVAVFDSVSVGLAKRLHSGPITDLLGVRSAYEALLEDPQYHEASVKYTAGNESVHTRFSLAEQAFKDIG